MTIYEIYEAACQRGLARSKRHFSSALLGMAPNYLADRAAGGCSAVALLNLYRRLGELGEVGLQAMAFERLLAVEPRDGGARAVRP